MANNVNDLKEIVNKSGYPLQIHLEHLVNDTTDKHDWKILTREHRWIDERTQHENYIDLVQYHMSYVARLIVECKRILGNWIFLLPKSESHETSQTKVYLADFADKSRKWKEWTILPETKQSSFCIMEIVGKRDNRTLEKLAGDVLMSCEYISAEEVHTKQVKSRTTGIRMYIPVIVTTAKLHTYYFSPENINVDDGSILQGAIEEVPFIRFRKNLATGISIGSDDFRDIDQINLAYERTVFVIQAKHFIEWLGKFAL